MDKCRRLANKNADKIEKSCKNFFINLKKDKNLRSKFKSNDDYDEYLFIRKDICEDKRRLFYTKQELKCYQMTLKYCKGNKKCIEMFTEIIEGCKRNISEAEGFLKDDFADLKKIKMNK